MPFFSFSVNQIKPSLKKFNIATNCVYFSKNTQLWKILKKENKLILNFLKLEKRNPVQNINKNILFCLPPSIGLGDAIEYASAIKQINNCARFDKVSIAFSGDYSFLFRDYFGLKTTYPFLIEKNEMNKYDTVFHLTLEIKTLINQKYLRSNICEEILDFFNVQNLIKIKKPNHANKKIDKISIFPISSSPIRTMPNKILYELVEILKNKYFVEIFLDNKLEISKFLLNKIQLDNVAIIDPANKTDLIFSIKNIQYGIFMDSGPLHVAKMFNKRGVLIESSVSGKHYLKNMIT